MKNAYIALLAGALTAGACADVGPAESAAWLEDRTLTTARLAEMLVLAQPLPLTPDIAGELARHWLHVHAVARGLLGGDSIMDPDWVEAATWLERRGRLVDLYFRARTPEPFAEAERIADSVYTAGGTRLFAHVFRRIGAETRYEERQLQRQAAERIHSSLLAGGSWADAVRESEDATTRDNNGILGLVQPGEMDPLFENAAFALEPGQLSGVVATQYGFHIIHRPRLADIRPVFVRLLALELAGRVDSTFAADLAARSHLVTDTLAQGILRTVAADPWSALTGNDTLAVFDGGAFTESTLARYLVHLPPDARHALTQADHTRILEFLRPLVLDELILHHARTESVGLPDSVNTVVRNGYRQLMEQLVTDAGIAEALAATAATPEARADTAVARIDTYMDAIAARRVDLQAVPPLLAIALLEGSDHGIAVRGVEAAIARASRLIEAAGDSVRGTQPRT
jgi:hypothetical protein